MTDLTKPMPLPPLPKLNIPEQEAIADTPKIDLTPVDLDTSKVELKPTEEQIGGIKPLLWVGLGAAILFGISLMQGSKTVSTEIQNSVPQVRLQSASTTPDSEPVVEKPKTLPMPERDPDKVQINLLLLSHLNNGKNSQDQLVEARASWYRLQAQTASQRNPRSYPDYLAGQLDKVNLELANQVKANQTTLVGTDEQTAIGSKLLIESQAIALELIRWKVANGEMTDIPEDLRSRLMPSAVSPYVQLASFARDSDNITYLNKLNLLADREQDEKRVANLEAQRLQAATQAKKQATLPVPKK